MLYFKVKSSFQDFVAFSDHELRHLVKSLMVFFAVNFNKQRNFGIDDGSRN